MGDITIPYFFAALMVLEFGWNAIRRHGHQTPRDSMVSLMVAVPHFALLTILPVVWFAAYRALEPAIPGRLPEAWWIWPLGIAVMDFAAYWMHRYHHALNLTWAVHSVHHSSDELTIATGGRSSMAEPLVNIVSGAYLILVAPALIGLPVEAAGFGWLVKDSWGFAVHTRNIDRLGILELVLATPSHHRVHHAINPIYQGKNFGFVFIVWDRLFGTFQPELRGEPPIYGTTDPPASFQPIAVAFHGLSRLWRDAVATRRWRDKLGIWWMPAGWRPPDLVPIATGHARYQPPAPEAFVIVGGLQLAYFVVATLHLGLTVRDHGVAVNLAYLGFLVLGTITSGEFFECSRGYPVAEAGRAIVVIAMLAATGGWFDRPTGTGLAISAIVLGVANAAAAVVVLANRRTRCRPRERCEPARLQDRRA